MRRTTVTVITLTSVVLLAACTGTGVSSTPRSTDPRPTQITPAPDTTTPPTTDGTGTATASTVPASSTTSTTTTVALAGFSVSPGTEQVTITGAAPGTTLELVDRDGAIVVSGQVDDAGSLLFRGLSGGEIVHVRGAVAESAEVKVMSPGDTPLDGFYTEQRLPLDDLGYITTRDGTTLSAHVWLPGPVDDGPYPTVVEYSGYTPSDPASEGFADIFTGLGYAYVGVNIRGTGCSGGSFRFFEYAQSLDGYDAIEVVAAQPWVRDHRVGMVGVSYPGISQLFVAQTQPPSLAAITPFSVLADSYQSTLYPGGILNTGFAVAWTEGRMTEARPSGQAWAAERIAAGDETCAANQAVRLQNPDLTAEIYANPFWNDETSAEIAPRLFVDRITVPTFVAGAWQDEQTGAHFATMLDRFVGTDRFYATLMNGLHTESIGPAVFPRLVEFLDLYVAERVPSLAQARILAPALAMGVFGTADVALPTADRFAGMTYEEALAAFEADPPIEVLFEEGAADGFPDRTPLPRFTAGFESWPVPAAVPTAWNLSGDGTAGGLLATGVTGGEGETTAYLALPDAIPPTFYAGSSSEIWSTDVVYDWQQGGAGTYASWATAPLTDDVVVVGSGSVDLWITSNLGDTDLEVTVTEVRPDGQEMYVQSGWLRASHRALDVDASTPTRPVHTHREEDAAPLPDGEFTLVRVELLPFAHAFRSGSRIRLIVDAPGGNRAIWTFDTIAQGEQVTIAHHPGAESAVVLPVVDGIDVPDAPPTCGALRGQPCRAYTGP